MDNVFYVIKGSLDQTEGRTGYVDRQMFHDLDAAVKVLLSGHWGIQGVAAHSEMVSRSFEFNTNGTVEVIDVQMWGYHKSRDGKWRHGWVDDRDVEEFKDPEFQEFLRLKEKFDA